MSENKSIMLCADDYGLNDEISQGIRQLVAMNRLSAVSCMVNFEDFERQASALSEMRSKALIGLHFNLTEGEFLSAPKGRPLFSLKSLLFKSHLGLLKPALLRAELNSQLDRFEAAFDRVPDFIDGHQHVHQFPGIRGLVLEIYQQRYLSETVMVRSTFPAIASSLYRFKVWVLKVTGGKAFQKKLIQNAISHNPFFSGIYDFSPNADYRTLFQQWLDKAPDGTLFMCHPAIAQSRNDPIAEARFREFSYLGSDAFLSDCKAAKVGLLSTGPES